MKKPPRPLRLRAKLFAGLGVVALMVLALQAYSSRVIAQATTRLEVALTQQVRPLARINGLQAQLGRVRVLEVELPRVSDFFAVTAQTELMRSERMMFAHHLRRFIADQPDPSRLELRSLEDNWRRYDADLQRISTAAAAMNMKAAEDIASFESSAKFKSLSHLLRQMVEATESEAAHAFNEAASQQESQRRAFAALSMFTLVVVVFGGAMFTRSLSHRISSLRDAAAQLADGVLDEPVPISGRDELADLGVAFNAMREKVVAREEALRAAHDRLEERVSERTQELNAMNSMLGLVSMAAERSPVSLMITDARGVILYVNRTLARTTGYLVEELLGESPRLLSSGHTQIAEYERMWQTILAGGEWMGDLLNRRRDGTLQWEQVRISPVTGADGSITHFVAVQEDIGARKEEERRMMREAQHDVLTQLPNRALALDRLSQAINSARRSQTKVVAMLVDLDGFKRVNDLFGHDAANLVLVQAARRLESAIRGVDTVARQGGDEFLVIMGGLRDTVAARSVATKIVSAFSPDFALDDSHVTVTASIGAAVFPDDGETVTTLLQSADLAMHAAKRAGRNGYRFLAEV